MIEAQGGRAAHVEMIAGGWIGSKQIQKVNKSPATGRVTSVTILAPCRYSRGEDAGKLVLSILKTERLSASVYRAPTEEELTTFKADKVAAKKKAKATGPKKPSLINPTLEDAQKLQDLWNAEELAKREKSSTVYYTEFVPEEVCKIVQKLYSAASKGTYARTETKEIGRAGLSPSTHWGNWVKEHNEKCGPVLCKVRTTGGDSKSGYTRRVIFITDKPCKALPAESLKELEACKGRWFGND